MERLLAMATIWCNGEWLDSANPAVAWSDRGLLHGLGLFETLLAVDGRPVHVDRHLKRFSQGLQRLGWFTPDENFKDAMVELLKRNDLLKGRSRIRLAMTGGSGGLRDLSAGEDRLCWMSASELGAAPASLKLGIGPWRRNEHSAITGLKCASYAENLVALDWAGRDGFDEVLFLNPAGDLCEAACANVFLVRNGALLTPELKSGCLPGVARARIMELAAGLGLELQERRIAGGEIEQAEECFLSSATRGVMPVSHFRKTKFGECPLTRQLAQAWEASITRH